MRIPDITVYGSGAYSYGGNQRTEIVPKPSGSGMFERREPNKPENMDIGQNGKVVYTPAGDILDFDWNRIRRFVQRFAWQTEPPDSVRDYRDYWENKAPTLSWDGDRVEFDYKQPENSNKTYGSEGTDKVNIVEPKGECQTCANRRYVDQSDDASVSYQTPTKLSPSTAALAVGSHEREHVFNERAKAEREGRKIVNQTVSIKYAICPECHKMYASGGVTRTQSVSTQPINPPPSNEDTSPAHNKT